MMKPGGKNIDRLPLLTEIEKAGFVYVNNEDSKTASDKSM